MENPAKPSVCVAGVGAIGGLLAALLSKSGAVTLNVIARGARGEAFRENGIVLKSDIFGPITARPAAVTENGASLGRQDYILVCVKNYSLDAIARQIAPCIGKDTVLLPVMNGIEPGDRLRRLFPDAIVGDSVIYTITSAEPDFSARQEGSHTHMFVGTKASDEHQREAVKKLAGILRETGLDCRWTDDIESAVWQKYILNCAFNSVTARYQTDTGGIRADAVKAAELKALLEEAFAVGTALGVALPAGLIDKQYRGIMEKQTSTATSSLKRDIAAHHPTELDAFLGALLQKAKETGVATPISARYYEALKALAAGE